MILTCHHQERSRNRSENIKRKQETDPIQDGLSQLVEGGVDVNVGLGRRLQESNSMILGDFLSALLAHYSPLRHVALVPEQHFHDIF